MFGNENSCMYYVLPMVKLGKPSFGTGNLKQCYIDRDYKVIAVVDKTCDYLLKHENYFTDFVSDGELYYVFTIPNELKPDFVKYMNGKFSQMSDHAKDLIRRCSGLKYKYPLPSGGTTTSVALMVLDRSEALRRRLEDDLGVDLHPEQELASVPGDNVYMSLTPEEG